MLHFRFDDADRHAQRFEQRPHLLRVAAGEIIVHRGQLRPLSGQALEVERQRGGQRFAFARLHFGDRTMVHGDAAQHLHVEVPHAHLAPPGLAHQGKRLGQQSIERFLAFGPITQSQAAFEQFLVAQGHQFRLEGGDRRQQRLPTGQPAANRRLRECLQPGLQTFGNGRPGVRLHGNLTA